MAKYVENAWLETTTCYKCACMFAWPAELLQRRRNDHKSFWCPNGHEQHFTGPSEADRLREEVERQRQMREAEGARAQKLTQERDQVARAHHRMRQRVMNGVCPCCNRTFQNLLRHMQTEHAGEFSLKNVREAFGMTQAQVAAEVGVSAPYVSNHERGRPIPSWAKQALESWVDRSAGKERA